MVAIHEEVAKLPVNVDRVSELEIGETTDMMTSLKIDSDPNSSIIEEWKSGYEGHGKFC